VLELVRRERTDGGRVRQADPPHRVVGRVQPPDQGEPVDAVPVAPRQGAGRRCDGAGLQPPGGDDQERDRGLDGRRRQAFRGDDGDAGGGIEAPPQSRLREEGIEHRQAARADVSSSCRTR
jgi:hypothetical protein